MRIIRRFNPGQAGIPAAPTLSGTADSVNAQIDYSWTIPEGATSYKFQVDDNPDFTSPNAITRNDPNLNGYSYDYPGDATYYARVQACNALGCSVWSNVVTITIGSTVSVPTAPTLSGSVTGGDDLDYSWTAPTGTDDYTLQIADNSGFTGASAYIKTVTTHLEANKSAATYYARVKACNTAGCSVYSNVVELVVSPPATAPAAPTLSGSVSGDDLSYSWTAPAGADDYVLQIADNSTFTGASSYPQLDTAHSEIDQPNGTYYARVQAYNEVGGSGWSNVVSLIVDVAAPILAAPTLSGSVDVNDLSYSWNDPNADVIDNYTLQVSTALDFSVIAETYTGTALSKAYIDRAPGTYYARVNTSSSGYQTSAWSNTVTLTAVEPAPEAPTLSGSVSGTDLSYSWTAPTGTDDYTLEIADNSTFTTPTIYTKTTTTHIESGRAFGTYYARIKANNQTGSSAWSNVVTLDLVQNVPAAPTLSGSVGGWDGSTGDLSYSWTAPSGADDYVLEVDISSTFAAPERHIKTVTSHTILDYPPETFYARVKARNEAGSSAWSNVITLTIKGPPTTAITLYGKIENGTEFLYSWDNVPAVADEVFLQVSDIADFSTTVVGGTFAVNGTFRWTTPTSAVKYYARARATNTSGDGPWSNVVELIISTALSAPVLSGSHNMPAEPTITYNWTDPNTNEKNYYIQVARNSTFTDVAVSQWQTFLKFTTGALLKSRYYYARVRAENDTELGPWSNVVEIYLPTAEPTAIKPVRAYVEGLKEYEANGIYFTDMRTICVEFDHDIQLASGNTSSDNPFPLGYKAWGVGPIHAGRANLKISNYGFYEGKGTFNKLFVYGATVSGKILKLQIPATFHHTFTGTIYLGGGNNSAVTYKGNSSIKIDKSYDVNIEKPGQETSSNDLRITGCDMKWNGSRIELFVATSAMFNVENEYGNSMVKDAAQGNFKLYNDNKSVFSCTGITHNSISSSDYGTVLYIWFDGLNEPDWAHDHTLYFNTNNPEGNPLTIGNNLYGEILRQDPNVGGYYPINYLF
jgi:hypothetical protein